ncbi:hypothetical protein AMS68_001302 [Peltaster fructicola]|uniref:Ribosomal protein L22 n=1 Tax=Peltaster fructicola TaxID=286661 RepID=A0A6H0XMC7_9PEZI|nr:hypothetical protein AMS68_001302 [Peltaster fructicola]
MSIAAPAQRLSPRWLSYRTTVRTIQSRFASSKKRDDREQDNPVLEEYLRKNPVASKREVQQAMAEQQQYLRKPGDISPTSIFEDAQRSETQSEMEQESRVDGEASAYDTSNRQMILDPDPRSRERWERKKVIQAVRKGGRMTREQMIKRTEREHLAKSEQMKTSVKKLGMLARQIAGKTLEDAVTQMRFSSKKAAITVREHLDRARDEAVVMRGMGLGSMSETEDSESQHKPEVIRLKDGKKHTVTDPKKLYIAQAWVGRGTYGKLPDYRARGRMNIMRTPFTSLSVILKEESTRVREHKDREERRRKKRLTNLWTHLPDRPLQGPRGQYYCW